MREAVVALGVDRLATTELATRADLRGLGVGTRLIAAAEGRIRGHGLEDTRPKVDRLGPDAGRTVSAGTTSQVEFSWTIADRPLHMGRHALSAGAPRGRISRV